MTGHIKIAGVAGWPIHHSLSPLLQNYWLKNCKTNGAYTMFAVHPNEAIYAFKTLKKTTINGLNVTLPLKALAFEAADEVTPDAQKLGVCNVLCKRNGKLVGHNTDMEGFAAPLLEHIGHHYILNNAVTLVGAGGAARAALGSLLALGAPEIRIINRSNKRAKKLVSNINIPNLHAYNWSDRHNIIADTGLVINATAAGMVGHEKLDIDVSTMKKGSWIYDLIYTPLETPLMKQAQKHSLNTIGGLEMLIAQARPSFRLFYGTEPPNNVGAKEMLIKHLQANK